MIFNYLNPENSSNEVARFASKTAQGQKQESSAPPSSSKMEQFTPSSLQQIVPQTQQSIPLQSQRVLLPSPGKQQPNFSRFRPDQTLRE